MTEKPDGERRLTVDFAAWLDQADVPTERFFRTGLVALDANVLLDLYRLTPDARSEVLDAFARIGTRLWVPHQAAVEFSRNRKHVVEERMSSFKQVRRLLQTAAGEAVTVLESAVARLQELRERNGATRPWDLQRAALDGESLHARLEGVMDLALTELATLAAEHDLHPKDMQQVDPVLSQVDELLAGRIGPPYGSTELRALVEEAQTFRYPNKIPPGFLDAKGTPLLDAGDFLLWRQTIDKMMSRENKSCLVMLITKDFKEDWWVLDSKKRPRGPRPELVQEMRDAAQADLLLVSLRDFIVGTRTHLSYEVSDATLEQVQGVSRDAESLLPAIFRESTKVPNLLDLNPLAFERLIYYLLIQMGYDVETPESFRYQGYDLRLIKRDGPTVSITLVEVKLYRRPVPQTVVYQVLGVLRSTGAQSAMLITTADFTPGARRVAEEGSIELIDGSTLIELLARQGIRATIQFPDEG